MSHARAMVDGLESRVFLAGNVTAELVDGNLIILGDDRANEIILEADPFNPAAIRVVPGENTRLNGEFNFIELADFEGRINVDLGDGNNKLLIDRKRAPGGVRIITGDGDDQITLRHGAVHADLIIRSGGGRDIINVLGVNVGGSTHFNAGRGADLVATDNSIFGDTVHFNGGRGRDILYRDNSTFRGQVPFTRSSPDPFVGALNASFQFKKGMQGWDAMLADYFGDRPEQHEFKKGLRQLPQEIGEGTGFYVSSNNATDDVFMFLTRQIGPERGLRPNTTYQVRFDIRFASNAPTGCAGIGGSPGESVFLKAGAIGYAPQTAPDDEGIERLNADHGQQALSGSDISNIGTIGNGEACEPGVNYKSLKRKHVHTQLVKTDAQGRMWLIVGTDSGYEGVTSLYYQSIQVKLVPVT